MEVGDLEKQSHDGRSVFFLGKAYLHGNRIILRQRKDRKNSPSFRRGEFILP
jgi:hypothetical protein